MTPWQALPPAADLLAWAREYGTPLYVYQAEAIRQQYAAYDAGVRIHYAVKANSNLNILRLLRECGAGFDIVSGGELERALRAGAAPSSIVFSGVAKSDAELRRALEVGIGCFNVESSFELQRLAELAAEMQTVAPIALRINPEVDAQTHPYISTGMRNNKFGIALDLAPALYRWAAQQKSLKIIGLCCHIGSQITQIEPYREALQCLQDLAAQLAAEGITLEHLDIGGGLGIAMDEGQALPSPRDWVMALKKQMEALPYALHIQPGRSLVGNAGFLLMEVVLNKIQNGRHFVMVDAAMNDYLRPALYQARPHFRNLSREAATAANHANPQTVNIVGPVCEPSAATPQTVDIVGPVCEPSAATPQTVDIVGPVCESADTFIRDYALQATRGDVLAMAGVGAYGFAMASQYNSRPRPAEILLENGRARLIRRRESLEQLWQDELL